MTRLLSITNKDKIEKSCGNIFKDLELPDSQVMLCKSNLVFKINKIIKDENLNGAEASKICGIDRGRLYKLKKGDFNGFTIDRLILILDNLGFNSKILIHPHSVNGLKYELLQDLVRKHVYCDATEIIEFINYNIDDFYSSVSNYWDGDDCEMKEIKKWYFVSKPIAKFLLSENEVLAYEKIPHRNDIAPVPSLGHFVWGVTYKFNYYRTDEDFLQAIVDIENNVDY